MPDESRDISLEPDGKLGNKRLYRATYYITADDDDKLERVRLARRRKGKKVDKSALVREAIALLPEE